MHAEIHRHSYVIDWAVHSSWLVYPKAWVDQRGSLGVGAIENTT